MCNTNLFAKGLVVQTRPGIPEYRNNVSKEDYGPILSFYHGVSAGGKWVYTDWTLLGSHLDFNEQHLMLCSSYYRKILESL